MNVCIIVKTSLCVFAFVRFLCIFMCNVHSRRSIFKGGEGEEIKAKNVNHSSLLGKIATNGTEFSKQKNFNRFCNSTE